MDASVGAQIEAEGLALWTEHASVVDGAAWYDQLREGLADEYQRFREARKRGWRGQEDADRALREIVDLVLLLDAIAEALVYRRGLYLDRGRPWPLNSRAW